jgi:hypothetical protein
MRSATSCRFAPTICGCGPTARTSFPTRLINAAFQPSTIGFDRDDPRGVERACPRVDPTEPVASGPQALSLAPGIASRPGAASRHVAKGDSESERTRPHRQRHVVTASTRAFKSIEDSREIEKLQHFGRFQRRFARDQSLEVARDSTIRSVVIWPSWSSPGDTRNPSDAIRDHDCRRD